MNEHFQERIECPCCGSATASELCRNSYTENPLREYLLNFYGPQGGVDFYFLEDQDFILMECRDCGLIYQKEIPNGSLMSRLYEKWIDPVKSFELHEKNRDIRYFARLSSEIINIVKLFDRPPRSLSFLDYSMGWGHWCRIAQSFGCNVHGTEFSNSKATYARSTGVTVIDTDEIPFHRYDFINAEQVFEHLPEIRSTLSFLAGSLKPKGILKIAVPNGWNIKERLKTWDWSAGKGTPNSLNAVAPLEHINCFHHNSLVTLGKSCGLALHSPREVSQQKQQIHGFKDGTKAFLRKCHRKLKGSDHSPLRKGTSLYFQSRDRC